MIIELTLRFTFRQTETPGSCYPAQAAFCKHVQQLDLGDSTGSVCQHDASGPVDSVQKQIDQPGCRKFIWYVFQSQNNQNMKRLKRLWFFSGVSSLVELELSNNFLKSIPISALASLTNLKFLNLGSNKIQVTTNFGGYVSHNYYLVPAAWWTHCILALFAPLTLSYTYGSIHN